MIWAAIFTAAFGVGAFILIAVCGSTRTRQQFDAMAEQSERDRQRAAHRAESDPIVRGGEIIHFEKGL